MGMFGRSSSPQVRLSHSVGIAFKPDLRSYISLFRDCRNIGQLKEHPRIMTWFSKVKCFIGSFQGDYKGRVVGNQTNNLIRRLCVYDNARYPGCTMQVLQGQKRMPASDQDKYVQPRFNSPENDVLSFFLLFPPFLFPTVAFVTCLPSACSVRNQLLVIRPFSKDSVTRRVTGKLD